MMSVAGLSLLQHDARSVLGSFFGGPLMLVWLAIIIVFAAAGWKVFEKAGQPGWAIIVPIYNIYLMLKIVGRPGWWLLLYFIPVLNVLIGVIVSIDMAKSFGQSPLFGVFLLFLLCGVGYLILGFGSARYIGPGAAMPQARAAGA